MTISYLHTNDMKILLLILLLFFDIIKHIFSTNPVLLKITQEEGQKNHSKLYDSEILISYFSSWMLEITVSIITGHLVLKFNAEIYRHFYSKNTTTAHSTFRVFLHKMQITIMQIKRT